MKLNLNLIPTLSLCVGFASASLLINPAAQPQLPTVNAAKASASAVGLNLTDIQGDILIGMKKNKEFFLFFGISNVKTFKAKLRSTILPLVTPTPEVLPGATQPNTLLNIAFSFPGLVALNVTDPTIGDVSFTGGQEQAASNLGDPGTTNWVPQFVNDANSIHGVILLASDTVDNVNATLNSLQSELGDCITEIYSLQAAARPGAEQGHEHFGFLDGISNPAVVGFQTPLPGQAVVPTGQILVGEPGDQNITVRPSWAKVAFYPHPSTDSEQWVKDGSFLVFRQLKQLVPEFNKFLTDNPIREPALTPQQGSDLLGARMIGRWKSGAPVFLSPFFDNATLGNDTQLNNDFTYAVPGTNNSNTTDQSKCPVSAHIRKTRPRADLGLPENTTHHIVRGGIPYGPEVTAAEASSNTTEIERGLAFVAYQSDISLGFEFLQEAWANNPNFRVPNTGYDPIIGADEGAQRFVTGLDPTNTSRSFTLATDFVVSRGGQYFFSPSLSAIANTLSV
ncbi:fungal peroxidase [Mycena maculata]|uniref:Fungal peroxidase n=1 Tax=Mycena maculata TaxID=230809 RepID=A0AAD7HYQ5_9AGAR|nr:fungal peroxidase [Mycena maculata]